MILLFVLYTQYMFAMSIFIGCDEKKSDFKLLIKHFIPFIGLYSIAKTLLK